MINVIYHNETGLVLKEGVIENNDIFSTTQIDEKYGPIDNEKFILINHNTKSVIDVNFRDLEQLENIDKRVLELKNELAQLDLQLVDNINNEEYKNHRINLRNNINELQNLKETDVLKFNLKGKKYKIIKYIEGVVEYKNVEMILKSLNKLIELNA